MKGIEQVVAGLKVSENTISFQIHLLGRHGEIERLCWSVLMKRHPSPW